MLADRRFIDFGARNRNLQLTQLVAIQEHVEMVTARCRNLINFMRDIPDWLSCVSQVTI